MQIKQQRALGDADENSSWPPLPGFGQTARGLLTYGVQFTHQQVQQQCRFVRRVSVLRKKSRKFTVTN